MAREEFLIEWSSGRLWTGVGRVRHLLVAQRRDRHRVIVAAISRRAAYPGPCIARTGNRICRVVADNAGDGRSSIWVGAIHRVIALRERRSRYHRRVHVLGLSRHIRNLVAELAVGRVV